LVDPTGLDGCDPDDPSCGGGCDPSDPTCGGGGCFVVCGGGGNPINPGPPPPGATPSTFPTAPGINTSWQSILFGPPDPSLLVINNAFPGTDDCPSLWPFSAICQNQIQHDNLGADQQIYNDTDPFFDPFKIAFKPAAIYLAEIHNLERVNLMIDKALIGKQFGNVVSEQPWLAGWTADQYADIISKLRDKNNQQIDFLLQEAANALTKK
jgi:hypothetical protein